VRENQFYALIQRRSAAKRVLNDGLRAGRAYCVGGLPLLQELPDNASRRSCWPIVQRPVSWASDAGSAWARRPPEVRLLLRRQDVPIGNTGFLLRFFADVFLTLAAATLALLLAGRVERLPRL